MPKTQAPATVSVPGVGTTFAADAVPDVFDERDRIYRPKLTPLAPTMDVRRSDRDQRYVLTQDGQSCTGHAVATMVNTILENHPGPTGRTIRVSPYMLYRMARRYDEFEGEQDAGSSLRGALKGWYHHGLLPEETWSSLTDEPDIDLDRALADEAMRYPLGAFYRVHAFRLDDMQSAVTELCAIVASAAIHEGWMTPLQVRRGDETMHIIERPEGAASRGGHAFAIVGYNEVGFLVQNSWGPDWGRGGFATLPYDDWLASAYDAWVARPGVRSLVTADRGEQLVADTSGGLSTGRGPDLVRLQRHVVNLGNDGRLSTDGEFRSSPAQLEALFVAMDETHERWREEAGAGQPPPRRIVLYAHGGLNSESTGLGIAQKHLGWWLNNRVYPVTFAWQTGAAETLVNQLTDAVRGKLPFGGVGFDLAEQFDRLVEKVAGSQVRWVWDEMKENARRASEPADAAWPRDGSPLPADLAGVPGATLTAARLAAYCESTDEEVEVHLVGHSAGSIFLTALLPRLLDVARLPVRSVTFLAPAIRIDDFERDALPLLGDEAVRFTSFGLGDERELDDSLGAGPTSIYQKSLLYLVARGIERSGEGASEVPLLGMQRFARSHLDALVARMGNGELVWSPTGAPAHHRTDARTHGGLDDDSATMTSVLLRILGHRGEPEEQMTYRADAPLRSGPTPPVSATADGRAVPGQRPATSPLVEALERAGWRAG